MRKKFIVQKPITLGYGSHIHDPNCKSSKVHAVGTVLVLDAESFSGNVFFIDPDGERGKIECGEVRNLLRDGRVVPA